MKVRFLSTKFYVSEKRRTVTCVMTAKLDDRKSGQNNFRFTWEGEEILRTFRSYNSCPLSQR